MIRASGSGAGPRWRLRDLQNTRLRSIRRGGPTWWCQTPGPPNDFFAVIHEQPVTNRVSIPQKQIVSPCNLSRRRGAGDDPHLANLDADRLILYKDAYVVTA